MGLLMSSFEGAFPATVRSGYWRGQEVPGLLLSGLRRPVQHFEVDLRARGLLPVQGHAREGWRDRSREGEAHGSHR